MKINITTKPIDLHEDYEISPPDMASPLARAMSELTHVLNDHPEFMNVRTLINKNSYPDVLFPSDESVLDVEVVLCGRKDDLFEMSDVPHFEDSEMLGFFAVSAGPFDPERYFSNCFRVVVACDEAHYRQFVEEERAQELDPGTSSHDLEYLKAYLVTVTHEISHAVEFIQHGGGFTPHEVMNLCDEGAFEFSVSDVATGLYARKELAKYVFPEDDQEIIQIMEDRVEEKGKALLRWALPKIKLETIEACLETYAPAKKKASFRKNASH